MPRIIYAPKAWHGTDTAPNVPETVRLEAAVQAAFDAADKETIVVPLTANGTAHVWLARPTARTVSGFRARRQGTLASAGTITLAVQDGDGVPLLSTETIDAKALTTAFVAQALTATTANRALAAGEPLQVVLVSSNGDATGGPAIVEVSYVAE